MELISPISTIFAHSFHLLILQLSINFTCFLQNAWTSDTQLVTDSFQILHTDMFQKIHIGVQCVLPLKIPKNTIYRFVLVAVD